LAAPEQIARPHVRPGQGVLPPRNRRAGGGASAPETADPAVEGTAPARPADMDAALRDYFYRMSRMPPSAATGFDPLVSPAWAGRAMPG
jgi:hypothetical protein